MTPPCKFAIGQKVWLLTIWGAAIPGIIRRFVPEKNRYVVYSKWRGFTVLRRERQLLPRDDADGETI